MMGGTKGPRDALADLKKVFETEFWTESSSDDDEGIGSDDSMENTSNSADTESEEVAITRTGLRESEEREDGVEVRDTVETARLMDTVGVQIITNSNESWIQGTVKVR